MTEADCGPVPNSAARYAGRGGGAGPARAASAKTTVGSFAASGNSEAAANGEPGLGERAGEASGEGRGEGLLLRARCVSSTMARMSASVFASMVALSSRSRTRRGKRMERPAVDPPPLVDLESSVPFISHTRDSVREGEVMRT